MAYWWDDDESERYWCEITLRPDIGADLKCPQLKVITAPDGSETGVPYWSYTLINAVAPGDIVFHYSGKSHAYVGVSVAGGPVEEREIVWNARGTAGRARGETLAPKPGWRLPLYGFRALTPPLTLKRLQEPAEASWVLAWLNDVQTRFGTTGAPLMPYRDTLRGAQGYLTKMPRAFVERWPELRQATDLLADARERVEAVVVPPTPLPPLEDVEPGEVTLEDVMVPPASGATAGTGRPGGGRSRRSRDSKRIGDRAEEIVFRSLERRATAGEISDLSWRARAGETPGWDIDYRAESGELVAVEVKGTCSETFSSFDVTAQEWEQAEVHGRRYEIHLVTRCTSRRPRITCVADPRALIQCGRLTAKPATWEVRLVTPSDRTAGAALVG